MGDFTLPLRAALLTLITADATMIALIGTPLPVRVFDYVPQETPFPYLRVGDDAVTDWGDKTTPGQQFLQSFHIFDRTPANRGQKKVNEIQARLYALLHEQQVTVTGGTAYLVRFDDQRALTDDGLMWHGISRYRFLLS